MVALMSLSTNDPIHTVILTVHEWVWFKGGNIKASKSKTCFCRRIHLLESQNDKVSSSVRFLITRMGTSEVHS